MIDTVEAQVEVNEGEHSLVFMSDGYHVIKAEGFENPTYKASFIYNGGSIGIAPRFIDYDVQISFTLENQPLDEGVQDVFAFATASSKLTYRDATLKQERVPGLIIGQTYELEVVVYKTNYRFYLNGSLVINIDYSGISNLTYHDAGFALCATMDNAVLSVEALSSMPYGWETNAGETTNVIIEIREESDEEKYFHLSSLDGTNASLKQEVLDIESGDYTLSFYGKGDGVASIKRYEGGNLTHTESFVVSSEEWEDNFFSVEGVEGATFEVSFSTLSNNFNIKRYQLGKGIRVKYLPNTSLTGVAKKEKSLVTYPAKGNIRPEIGSISMWVSPNIKYSGDSEAVFFEYGETTKISLEYRSGEVVFSAFGDSVSIPTDLEIGEWVNLSAVWDSSSIQVFVNTSKESKEGSYEDYSEGELIYIGSSADEDKSVFYGLIDEVLVYSSMLTIESIVQIVNSANAIPSSQDLIMRATFNHSVANFNNCIIEGTLKPLYGSPVLVEKRNGDMLRKVSFINHFTGEYQTFNEEVVEYDRDYDYIEISYYEKDIELDNFNIHVEDENGITYGKPYSIKNRKITLTLEDDEKKKLDGKLLYVQYQLKDSYTLDFNVDAPDSFRVTLGKHDGTPVKITHEGNRFSDEKLLTMVELNPMLNPNHEGFLYITNNIEKVNSFRIRATPHYLPANGGTSALVLVEPLDTNGNYVSHCSLEVFAEKGILVPAYDLNSVKLRDRAGRFLYRYTPPVVYADSFAAKKVKDQISVIDKETGIGAATIITLIALEEKTHVISALDTVQKIAEKYGATVEDIMLADSNLTILQGLIGEEFEVGNVNSSQHTELFNRYLAQNVGTELSIPVNYSSRQVQKSSDYIEQEQMIGFILESILENSKKPDVPQQLLAILDLNGDGIINHLETEWLTAKKNTIAIQNKYNELLEWLNNN